MKVREIEIVRVLFRKPEAWFGNDDMVAATRSTLGYDAMIKRRNKQELEHVMKRFRREIASRIEAGYEWVGFGPVIGEPRDYRT
jgi:hypothetical protein